MAKSKAAQRALEDSINPPDSLNSNELIVSVLKPRGNNLYEVQAPESEVKRLNLDTSDLLISMPPKFRNTVFVKRGGYAVVKLSETTGDVESKVKGEFIGIVMNVKDWQKHSYWPEEFRKNDSTRLNDMMPSSSDEEFEYEEVE